MAFFELRDVTLLSWEPRGYPENYLSNTEIHAILIQAVFEALFICFNHSRFKKQIVFILILVGDGYVVR